MASWRAVERVGFSLPESTLGQAHEGSPAVVVRKAQFARLRWDEDGRELLQFWVAEPDLVQAYPQDDPQTYAGMPGFAKKVVLAHLDRLDERVLRELLVESWSCLAPISVRRAHPGLR